MCNIERTVELLQEADSEGEIVKFVEESINDILAYVQLADYKEGQKTRRLVTLDYLKAILSKKYLASRLCTEAYVFGLRAIRKNSSIKKVSDGVVFLCYEIYTESVKVLLEMAPEEFLNVIYSHPTLCYLEELVKSSECNSVVEMFPCFFSLSGKNFERWINLLVCKEVVSMLFKYYNKPGKPHKNTQNLSKLLYLFVSFTGNLFLDPENMKNSSVHYAFFYREIEKRTHALLDTAFMGNDSLNRIASLEVIREMIRVNEFLPQNESSFFSFLYRYLAHAEVLRDLKNNVHSSTATVRIVRLINTLSRTIRFKSVYTLGFMESSELLKYLAVYLHSTATHTVTNEICHLLNELIYTDKIFYIQPIIHFCQEIKSLTLKRAVCLYALSQKRHNPHVSISDCITPVIYILYKLYYLCLFDSTNRNREAKGPSKRFVVIDEGADSYKILQQLEFLQEEHSYWYMTTRVVDYERRISLEYCWSFPERSTNAEQFARYFCKYSASVLPAYPGWLFQ